MQFGNLAEIRKGCDNFLSRRVSQSQEKSSLSGFSRWIIREDPPSVLPGIEQQHAV